MARTGKPDFILTDINLKGDMDGIEIEELLIGEMNIPVIFLTAHSNEEMKIKRDAGLENGSE